MPKFTHMKWRYHETGTLQILELDDRLYEICL